MEYTIVYGSVEIKQFNKFEKGRMYSYGYSIHRDRDGNEVSRTNPELLSSIGFDDRSPFIEEDYNRIMHGKAITKRYRIFDKLKDLIRLRKKDENRTDKY